MISADQRHLVFEPVGEGAWRLCDPAVGERDSDHVVAYVERARDGDLEVVWLQDRRRPSRHHTREEVVRAASVRPVAPRSGSGAKPIAIPYLSPRRQRP